MTFTRECVIAVLIVLIVVVFLAAVIQKSDFGGIDDSGPGGGWS